jgi:hypothetical protein
MLCRHVYNAASGERVADAQRQCHLLPAEGLNYLASMRPCLNTLRSTPRSCRM